MNGGMGASCCYAFALFPELMPAMASISSLQKKVTVVQQQTTALKVIEALDKQSNYSFTFAPQQLTAIPIARLTAHRAYRLAKR